LAAPALFTADGSGKGQAAALNQDGTLNSVTNPASAASIVTVYGTGFGTTAPISKDGVLSGLDPYGIALPVRVAVGGKEAKVTYSGSAPGLVVGVSQINFQIPSGVELGTPWLVVSAGEFTSAAVVTIAVK
jgi:uncharacterized protein (TIGR03437 family)